MGSLESILTTWVFFAIFVNGKTGGRSDITSERKVRAPNPARAGGTRKRLMTAGIYPGKTKEHVSDVLPDKSRESPAGRDEEPLAPHATETILSGRKIRER